ncbi:MAG: hypothetical protein ACYDH6_20110 [Acidimicrobiales bacterium]
MADDAGTQQPTTPRKPQDGSSGLLDDVLGGLEDLVSGGGGGGAKTDPTSLDVPLHETFGNPAGGASASADGGFRATTEGGHVAVSGGADLGVTGPDGSSASAHVSVDDNKVSVSDVQGVLGDNSTATIDDKGLHGTSTFGSADDGYAGSATYNVGPHGADVQGQVAGTFGDGGPIGGKYDASGTLKADATGLHGGGKGEVDLTGPDGVHLGHAQGTFGVSADQHGLTVAAEATGTAHTAMGDVSAAGEFGAHADAHGIDESGHLTVTESIGGIPGASVEYGAGEAVHLDGSGASLHAEGDIMGHSASVDVSTHDAQGAAEHAEGQAEDIGHHLGL